jgi:WXXGXW repeat (2 copies)
MRDHWLRSLIPALTLAALPILPSVSHAGVAVGVSINIAPPVLPVYVQPPLPAPGYMWSPGYWAYGDAGYYWVPGTWVLPPSPGLLWTPGYWGWSGGVYLWHGGYWGPHIGFYGGVNYGFGYGGVGFQGGYWHGGSFFYNRAVLNVGGVHITNVYNRTVINNNVSHVAFNGGPGGLQARATAHELAAEHDHHVEATAAQMDHQHAAAGNRALLASENHGRPAIAATARPGQFSGHGVVGARGSGPKGGPAHTVAHNTGPAHNAAAAHNAGPGGHGAPNPGAHPAAAPASAHNETHEQGRPGGGAPHANPHPSGGSPGGGHPGGARPQNHNEPKKPGSRRA